MEIDKVRSTFLSFFEKKSHLILPSSPLLPSNDPSLLFINSGMVQFKEYFTGDKPLQQKRVTTSQKCLRAGGKHNDLENVGYTKRHHTFFEMLGNFSFGDYFKEQAILFAWEFLTKELSLRKDKFYITIFHTDDEANELWKKITNFTESKIIKIKSKDNFWQMGDKGPCGPSSEIFYDHGEKYPGGLPGTKDEHGDRYVEIWNLVFMQYELIDDKKRLLPTPSIDTGIGLERLTAVLEGTNDNYSISLFKTLINHVIELSSNSSISPPHKVVADHIRAICFMLADGILPSNIGRGYVLRRIIRRACRHAYQLNKKELFLDNLSERLINLMETSYPELSRAHSLIRMILKTEETSFRSNLNHGLKILEENVSSNQKILDGNIAFKLYDTYGFPLDLTEDILKQKNIKIDHKGFDHAMKKQKEMARANWKGSGEKELDTIWKLLPEEDTEFVGYSMTETSANILLIIKNGVSLQSAKAEDEVIIILNQTPFYAEAGGQVGDTGTINGNIVKDTKKIGNVYLHYTKLKNRISVGDTVTAKIDITRRENIRRNHSATHLLHEVLKDNLGTHITQKGSIVSPEKLQFDFLHPKPLSEKEIIEIEKNINTKITSNDRTNINITQKDEALNSRAIALFGEKYDNEVRVVSIGNSVEFCGGTHVQSTGEIGIFKIINEESIASGIRRVTAVTGQAALEYIQDKCKTINDLATELKCKQEDIKKIVRKLTQNTKEMKKTLAQYTVQNIISSVQNGQIIAHNISLKLEIIKADIKEMRDAILVLSNENKKSLFILISVLEDKAQFVMSISKDLKGKYSVKDFFTQLQNEMKINGGGNTEIMQGVIETKKIDSLKSKIVSILK